MAGRDDPGTRRQAAPARPVPGPGVGRVRLVDEDADRHRARGSTPGPSRRPGGGAAVARPSRHPQAVRSSWLPSHSQVSLWTVRSPPRSVRPPTRTTTPRTGSATSWASSRGEGASPDPSWRSDQADPSHPHRSLAVPAGVSPPKKRAIPLTGSQVAPGLLSPVGIGWPDGVAATDPVARVLGGVDGLVVTPAEHAASSGMSSRRDGRRMPLRAPAPPDRDDWMEASQRAS